MQRSVIRGHLFHGRDDFAGFLGTAEIEQDFELAQAGFGRERGIAGSSQGIERLEGA